MLVFFEVNCLIGLLLGVKNKIKFIGFVGFIFDVCLLNYRWVD